MPVEEYFSATYVEARCKFREFAQEAGGEFTPYVNPTPDPEAIGLITDVVVIGPGDAKRCLLLISGTHGVEGFGGSGCQVGFLRDKLYESLSDNNTCAVLIHALNPYGFGYLRRVNEDNVDLNRNSQDFSKELPPNTEYETLHGMLIPDDWDGEGRRKADVELQTYIQKTGFRKFKDAVSAGQYTKPSGLFFGGDKLTWSVLTFQRILKEHVPRNVRRMVVIDLHTGLGPFGYGEPIFVGNDLRQFSRAQTAFGPELKSLEADNSASSVVTGTLLNALESVISIKDMTYLALEFGTIEIKEVLTALRGDHWLHTANNITSPIKEQIKRNLRDAFYVDSPQWKAAIYGRAVDFVTRATRYLAGPIAGGEDG